MSSWSPDVEINDAIALQLIGRRFPQLQPLQLRFLGRGWDNHAYLANESIVFRIPHRKLGAELMDIECAVLAYFARHSLPLRIPNPCFVAEPDEEFPYRIAGYPVIEGRTGDAIQWSEAERAGCAEPLGRFLSSLHRIPKDVPFAIGDNLARADLQYRLPKVLAKIKHAPAGFRELLEELAKTPGLGGPNVWVHGDLYTRHLIGGPSNELVGVIDWGDVHVGDPALDIAIAWMFLPPGSWEVFRRAYGGVDENMWRRARFRAMTHWVYISEYASETADACLTRECETVLRNVMYES